MYLTITDVKRLLPVTVIKAAENGYDRLIIQYEKKSSGHLPEYGEIVLMYDENYPVQETINVRVEDYSQEDDDE